MNRFEEAISCFNQAIELNRNLAYSYNNRGLSKIKLGRADAGLQDIHYSLTIEPDNSYGFRNLGIYHFDKQEYDEALRLFSKAKELDPATHMIEELITDTTNKLNGI